MSLKRYAVCGVSSRAVGMYIKPICTKYRDLAQVVGMLDIDPKRFEFCNEYVPESKGIPCYNENEFEKMIEETRPDAILVVCMDCHHVDYILKGLAHDLEVVTEKPMTTNTEDAIRVREAEKRSKGHVICTFNYRYNPIHTKVRDMVFSGKVGRVTHVDLTWYVDKTGEFRCDAVHHDGTDYMYYRKYKRGVTVDDIEDLKHLIYSGRATKADIDAVTEKLGRDIGRVYGWHFPKQKRIRSEPEAR